MLEWGQLGDFSSSEVVVVTNMQHSGSGDRECKSPDGAGQPMKVHAVLRDTDDALLDIVSTDTRA
ncbi:hypothetical protein NEOLEDRAFT_1137739 [Neolentinus lepideus HHB14362 ss-1]|uniref:Uncharacterized protein n=1 Tax=Neolentinus lepideus HHB14362 ss-1 TaxID=1314782 RepID=A0A165QKC1_9AGAM|nr:hypothetical protein NEOLEDRAFT_1137739 [Neolentinus lepideus HHB14362 ss-1]